MTVSERLSSEGLVDLPPEAGNIDAPKFDPDEAWLKEAGPELQKAAMWRWFATRYENPETAVPHDDEGNYLYGEGEPILADRSLHERFDPLVPRAVVEEVVAAVQREIGNEWACKRMDKAGA
jgi:hypothetical protein